MVTSERRRIVAGNRPGKLREIDNRMAQSIDFGTETTRLCTAYAILWPLCVIFSSPRLSCPNSGTVYYSLSIIHWLSRAGCWRCSPRSTPRTRRKPDEEHGEGRHRPGSRSRQAQSEAILYKPLVVLIQKEKSFEVFGDGCWNLALALFEKSLPLVRVLPIVVNTDAVP